MAIKRYKRGNRVYLEEYKSIRQGKKVISKFIRYVGPEDKLSTSEKTRNPGKLLSIRVINRVIDPESVTQMERWVPTTDLPYLAGISAKEITKDAVLSALDFVCVDDHGSGRVADLSAELGYNPKRIRRRQVNLAVLVSKHDKHPIAHFVYNGSRHSIITVKNLLARLSIG